MENDYEYDLSFVSMIGIIMLVIILAFIGLIRGVQEVAVRGEIAKIEQLRSDVKRVSPGDNQYVMGQVTQWNQEIQSAKRYRTVWWGRLCTPEEWESVNVIDLGDKSEGE